MNMIDWILLLCLIYIMSILSYDIYKEYQIGHRINKLRFIGVGICVFYMIRCIYRILSIL